MRITVSGKAYGAALDPLATSVPEESGWPKPTLRRVGRGLQAVYEVTQAQAADIAEHLLDIGGMLSEGGVDDEMREGQACLLAGHKILALLPEGLVSKILDRVG